MPRHRPTALAGLAAGIACNYWLLESWLAERTDAPRSWISDLATRTEASGWRFQALAILSGLAIAAFALLLLRVVATSTRMRLQWGPPDTGALRRGLLALFAVGACATVAGLAPLSCPEGIEPTCTLAGDPGDLVHAVATGGEILATVLAFASLAAGLGAFELQQRASASPGWWGDAGRVTLALGVAWLLLTAATALSYASGDVDAVKGILQRASQVLFGTWLALLGWWLAATPGAGEAGDLDHT